MARRSGSRATRWSPAAERDLGRAHAFLRARSPRLARALVERIIGVVDLIAEHPEVGAVAEELAPRDSFRHFPSPPYRVIYRVMAHEIWIARIWDTRRDPADLRLPGDSGSPEVEEPAVPPGDTKPQT